MNKLLLLSFIFTSFFHCLILQAQPVLDADYAPEIGENWEVKYVDAVGFSPGPGGPDQLWDFSDITEEGAFDLAFEIISPSGAPGASNFPNATFVWYMPGFEFYNYYFSDADSLALLGAVTLNNEMEINFLTIYHDPQDAFHFPVSFGDNYDYYAYYSNYLWGNFISESARFGSLTADGYGTIKTPFGTYEDVIRLVIVDENDFITETQHVWIRPDNFIPLMVYTETDDPETPPSLYYSKPNKNPVSAATDLLNKQDAQLNLLQNPVVADLQFTFSASAESQAAIASIYDTQGRQLMQARLDAAGTLHTVNVSQLDAGTYILVVKTAEMKAARLWVKE
jgi:hypothetical protein